MPKKETEKNHDRPSSRQLLSGVFLFFPEGWKPMHNDIRFVSEILEYLKRGSIYDKLASCQNDSPREL